MFTQKISMHCTEEQYKKYLKDELLKMGYKEEDTSVWDEEENCFISNIYNGKLGYIGNIPKEASQSNGRTYLGSFNAPLFLALAAMTDKVEGNYGEYVIGLRSGKIYKMDEEDKISLEYTMVRKVTKEEIMEKFGNEEPMWKSYSNTTKNLEEIYTAIELLKSKGYKILKPTTWEEV